MNESDPGIWKWLLEHMWVPMTGAAGAVWALLNARIVKAETRAENSIQRIEFKEWIERDLKEHDNLRQNQVKIFDKIDELKTLILARK